MAVELCWDGKTEALKCLASPPEVRFVDTGWPLLCSPLNSALNPSLVATSPQPTPASGMEAPVARENAFENTRENAFENTRENARAASSGVALSPQSHAVIEGDNLLALQGLVSQAQLDFHFIYIDPPYNSGQSFTFKDNAAGLGNATTDTESLWLSMMYPRLVLAHQLLRDEGAIFVSIDDREVAPLTLLLTEIFGKTNHIATLKWRKKRKPSFLDKHMSSTIEYVLVFAKNKTALPRLLGEPVSEVTRPVLNASNQVCARLLRAGTLAHCKDGVYPKGTRTNRTLSLELLDDAHVTDGKLVGDVGVRARFRVSQELLEKTVFITPQFGLRRRVLESEISRKHATDNCTDWATNEDAETELRKVFGTRVFDYAKPVGLLQGLLKMCSVPASGAFRCLDFFAGSGTLAEAVLVQNQADGLERTFVCVQSAEIIKGDTPAHLNLATIADITRMRVASALERIGTHTAVHWVRASSFPLLK